MWNNEFPLVGFYHSKKWNHKTDFVKKITVAYFNFPFPLITLFGVFSPKQTQYWFTGETFFHNQYLTYNLLSLHSKYCLPLPTRGLRVIYCNLPGFSIFDFVFDALVERVKCGERTYKCVTCMYVKVTRFKLVVT